MSNIYNLKLELLDIFNELEENGGELTPELEEQLTITQNEFTDKIRDYSKVIQALKNDITAIDAETNRLKVLKDSKKKIIERLTKILIEAIELFGDESKSGSKFVDYGDGKVSIRKSKTVELDEDNIKGIVDSYTKLVSSLIYNNQLHIVDGIQQDFLRSIALEHTERIGDEVCNTPIVFTDEDLASFEGEISFKTNFKNLLKGDNFEALKAIIKNIGLPKIDAVISKSYTKDLLTKENNGITVGRLVDNKNIIIK